jgi:hypothetical protein
MAWRRLPTKAPTWALLLALLGSGCAATFRDPRIAPGKQDSVWASYYLFGLLGRPELDVRDHCASGRAVAVETHADVVTVGVSVISLGIYTPRKVHISCEREPRR